MSREIIVAWAGRHDRQPFKSLCADYEKRISQWIPTRQVFVRPRGREDRRAQLESRDLLAAAGEESWIVALDERGKQMTSVEFSRFLTRLTEEWPRAISFVIGSDLGLEKEVLKSARTRLSLGKMTLVHELARVVLMEQIYRGFAIKTGIKYHRGPLSER